MFQTVQLPLWLLILILAFAAVTFASHFLFPSVRWFLRRRAERVIARLNTRLTRPIEPFKLLKRQDTIQRLIYDPQVVEAVAEYAKQHSVREDVAFELAHKYAREIVPSFSASTYFGFAVRVSRLLTRAFYRVESREMPEDLHQALSSDAAVVFVINHRSNMDYVLVIDLASDRSALSFAAGEWARMWPLGGLVRAAGAYFVRRRSGNQLYRRVMARYVQLATNGGVAQAIFPEGGLSLSGAVGEPKLGLLSYIIDDFDPDNGRDVLFVPVGINYDRVLEDRVLVRAAENGKRKFKFRWRAAARYLFRHAWQRLTGTFLKFGYAAVSFGSPLSLREFLATRPENATAELGDEVMSRIRSIVPVTPIPVAAMILNANNGKLSESDFLKKLTDKLKVLAVRHPELIHLHEESEIEARFAINHLKMRKMIQIEEGRWQIAPGNEALFSYYVTSIAHHFDADAENADAVSALARS